MVNNDWYQWTNPSKLPASVDTQIEDVHIEGIQGDKLLNAYIMYFVSNWINLKRISVPVSTRLITKFNVAEFNGARGKLRNACELTIFTNHKGNATNLDHNLVKLKFVEFNTDCEVFPFHDFTMASNQ